MNQQITNALDELYPNPISRHKVNKLVQHHISSKNRDSLELANFYQLIHNRYINQYEITNTLILYNTKRSTQKRIWKIDVSQDNRTLIEQNYLKNRIRNFFIRTKNKLIEMCNESNNNT